jgi:hypothetical protein
MGSRHRVGPYGPASDAVIFAAQQAAIYRTKLGRAWAAAATGSPCAHACISLIALCNMIEGLWAEGRESFSAPDSANVRYLQATLAAVPALSPLYATAQNVIALSDSFCEEQAWTRSHSAKPTSLPTAART